jgi:S1-C subfamily serine protease
MIFRFAKAHRLLCVLLALALAACSHFAAAQAPAADPAQEPSVIAVAKAMPAVVNISTERVVKRTVRDPYDDVFDQFFGGGAMRRPRTVRQTVQSLGSGFIVDPNGLIVTNEHVVERAADLKISVTTHDGTTYEAKYVAGTAESDLALIKIEAKEPLPHIDLDDLSPNLLGQTVLVLGNPLGYGSSVSRGILSAQKRTIAVNNAEYKDLSRPTRRSTPATAAGRSLISRGSSSA